MKSDAPHNRYSAQTALENLTVVELSTAWECNTCSAGSKSGVKTDSNTLQG
jgi:hypothetical protein